MTREIMHASFILGQYAYRFTWRFGLPATPAACADHCGSIPSVLWRLSRHDIFSLSGKILYILSIVGFYVYFLKKRPVAVWCAGCPLMSVCKKIPRPGKIVVSGRGTRLF